MHRLSTPAVLKTAAAASSRVFSNIIPGHPDACWVAIEDWVPDESSKGRRIAFEFLALGEDVGRD